MLKCSAAVGLLAALCLLVTVVADLPVSAYYVALGACGAYKGISNPPLESIFADSVPTGSR